MKKLALALVLSVVSIGSPAQAAQSIIKNNDVHDKQHFDIFAILSAWGYGTHLGLGAWYAIPIVPEGFLPTVNDAFHIELGGAFERYSSSWGYFGNSCEVSWLRVTPMGGVRWDFHLTDEWSVFGSGKAGFGVGFGGDVDCGAYSGSTPGYDYSDFVVNGSAGAHWRFSDTWMMRMELGWFGATVGAGLDL